MSGSLENSELAELTLEKLKTLGVRTLIVCPGARNSPWIEALEGKPGKFETLWHFDERAAAFFALGKSRADSRPVAVLTTSGTAAGELLPAAMEAYHCGVPLILCTADRPKRYRGTGAPQSCEQPGIFSHYVSQFLDVDAGNAERVLCEDIALDQPFQLNVCFEEPRPPVASARASSIPQIITPNSSVPSATRVEGQYPLVIVGELSPREASVVREQLLAWRLPVVTEALSQLREDPRLEALRIRPHRRMLEEAEQCGYPVDQVIRIGGVPTLGLWRDLDRDPRLSLLPVISLSSIPFSGLPRSKLLQFNLDEPDAWSWAPASTNTAETASFLDWKERQASRFWRLTDLLDREPWSEPGIFRALSGRIAAASSVYLGNSLPIREWDLAALEAPRRGRVLANRGLNGIDGQLSSFFGWLKPREEAWAILGDLTLLYDLNAPWVLHHLPQDVSWRLAVINNSGGKIFDRMFASKNYQNPHSIGFESWAKQWNLSYQRLSLLEDRLAAQGGLWASSASGAIEQAQAQVLEIIPDEESTRRFWREWEAIG